MRIRSIQAIPIRLPRDFANSKGTAGSPTTLTGSGGYRWSAAYPVLYSVNFETALVRVELEGGLVGWGEAQAPLAPEVACSIVKHLLAPALVGEMFDGSSERIASLWTRMYSTMRVRGHSGGFMLDAMSGVDIALWDLAGKIAAKPVCAILCAAPKQQIPAYLSGTSGDTAAARAEFARRYADEGIELVKLYYESEWSELLATADALPSGLSFAVDALWHMRPESASTMAMDLDARNARWLECPLYPEEVDAHRRLARDIRTPLAIGESYRSLREMTPFLDIAQILQPDLGRCGLSGSMEIAAGFAGETIPHLSIAMGPQIAAALHFAAAADSCSLCEYNPNVLDTANQFLARPLQRRDGHYVIPDTPGLGIEWNDRFASLW